MRRSDFEFLINLLRNNAGWDFDESQYFIIDKKMSAFIREHEFSSVDDVITLLKSGNKKIISQIIEAFTFSDTYFFRDFDIFYKFKNGLLPILKEKCRATKKLNIWSLGCSTGQETYSIAMAVDKAQNMFADWDVNILGSDLSSAAINKAQKGTYNNFEIQKGLNAGDIITYFDRDPENNLWTAHEKIKKNIEFRRYNLLDEVIVQSKFEVVFCRNVLQYFLESYQDAILHRISQKQPQGGYLYLGKNEYIPAVEKYYYKVDDVSGAYIAIGNTKTDSSVGNLSVAKADSDAMPSFIRPQNLI